MVKGGKYRYALHLTGAERGDPAARAVIEFDKALGILDVPGDRRAIISNAMNYPEFKDRNPFLLAGAILLYRTLAQDEFPKSVEFNQSRDVNQVAQKINTRLNIYGNRKRLEQTGSVDQTKIELYTYMFMIHDYGRGRKQR